jgi:hypothetical protein
VILLTKLDRDPGEMLRRVAAKAVVKPRKARKGKDRGPGAEKSAGVQEV